MAIFYLFFKEFGKNKSLRSESSICTQKIIMCSIKNTAKLVAVIFSAFFRHSETFSNSSLNIQNTTQRSKTIVRKNWKKALLCFLRNKLSKRVPRSSIGHWRTGPIYVRKQCLTKQQIFLSYTHTLSHILVATTL